MPIINERPVSTTHQIIDAFDKAKFEDKTLKDKIPITNTNYNTLADRFYRSLGGCSIYLRPENTHGSVSLTYTILTSDKFNSTDVADYTADAAHTDVVLAAGAEAIPFDEILLTSKISMVLLRFKSATPSEIGGIARVV